MNTTVYLALKFFLSGFIIMGTSWLAARKPYLAGFLIALPLISVLSILFLYGETRDMDKVNQYAASILVAVPLSLFFFVPFILNRWMHLNFISTFLFGIGLLYAAYRIHSVILR